jgi:HEAT repeat protein
MDASQLLASLPDFGAASEEIARGVPRAKALRTDVLMALEQATRIRLGVLSDCVFLSRNLHAETKGTALEKMFARIKDEDALDALLKLARGADPGLREAARRALGAVRPIVLELLAAQGAPAATLDLLLSCATDADPRMREVAIRRLRDSRDERAVQATLRCALTESDRRARYAAGSSVLDGPLVLDLRTLLALAERNGGQLRERVLERIGALGTAEARDALRPLEAADMVQRIADLAGEDEDARDKARKWLRANRGRALRDLAERLVENDGTRARFAACCRLAARPEPQRGSALVHALGDADEGLRRFAAWVLWELLEAPEPPDLLPALAHRLPRVRAVAASFLGRKRETRALPALAALLADGDHRVRRHAARAIADIGEANALRDCGAFDARLEFGAAPPRQ